MTDEQGTERQLVVFDLAGEAYGVNIETVREIIRMQTITTVPDTPDFIEGIINLRGSVNPVVDLRKRFNLNIREETSETRIVVVDIGGEDIGVVVDAVNEVLRITEDSVTPASSMVTTEDSYYIDGIAKVGDRLLILLDLDRLLSAAEITAATEARASAETAGAAGSASEPEPAQVA